MGWDRKRRGPAAGYFYESVRVPGTAYPVKVYRGRRAAGQMAAAAVALREHARRRDRDALKADQESNRGLDALATELREWAAALSAAWLVLAGYHVHHGCWRKARG